MHLTLRKAFQLIAVLTVTSGPSACAPRQSSSLTGENTATQFPSYTTYPETIPRWRSVDPQAGEWSDSKVDVALSRSGDWGHLVLTHLSE